MLRVGQVPLQYHMDSIGTLPTVRKKNFTALLSPQTMHGVIEIRQSTFFAEQEPRQIFVTSVRMYTVSAIHDPTLYLQESSEESIGGNTMCQHCFGNNRGVEAGSIIQS